MEPIKSFAIFKNTNKTKDTQPDYRMSVKIGDEYLDLGGAWIKEGKSGKFISCKLSDARDTRKGFRIVIEEAPMAEADYPKKDAPKDISPEDIGF
jgi:uncharacterized protein (DUF736 family)